MDILSVPGCPPEFRRYGEVVINLNDIAYAQYHKEGMDRAPVVHVAFFGGASVDVGVPYCDELWSDIYSRLTQSMGRCYVDPEHP